MSAQPAASTAWALGTEAALEALNERQQRTRREAPRARDGNGIARGDYPKRLTLEKPVEAKSSYSHWTKFDLVGEAYK